MGIVLALLKDRRWPFRRMVVGLVKGSGWLFTLRCVAVVETVLLLLLLRGRRRARRRKEEGFAVGEAAHAQDVARRLPDRQSMASSPVAVCSGWGECLFEALECVEHHKKLGR